MERRPISFYDFIGLGLGKTTYQEFVDKMMADTQNGLRTPGFAWSPYMQLDFAYDQIEAELAIYTMATYVDIDSPAPYKSSEEVELSSGKIPRFKHGYALNEKILRDHAILSKKMGGMMSPNLREDMLTLLFNHSEKLIVGNYNTLTYQRDQMISNGGFMLTTENNPGGIQEIEFKANIPSANKKALTGDKRWFIDDNGTEGSKSNPIADLKDMVTLATRKGVLRRHFEVGKSTFDKTLSHSAVRLAIGWAKSPIAGEEAAKQIGANITDDEAKTILERLIGAPIEVNENIVSVESFDKKTRKIVKPQIISFKENTWVLVPDGALGEIKVVEPIWVDDPAARVATYDGGRMVLKQTYDLRTNTQYIESECTALVVPDKPKYMFYLTIM